MVQKQPWMRYHKTLRGVCKSDLHNNWQAVLPSRPVLQTIDNTNAINDHYSPMHMHVLDVRVIGSAAPTLTTPIATPCMCWT